MMNPYPQGTATHKAWNEGFTGIKLFTHPMSAYGRAYMVGVTDRLHQTKVSK